MKPNFKEPNAGCSIYLGPYVTIEGKKTKTCDLWAMPVTTHRIMFWARYNDRINGVFHGEARVHDAGDNKWHTSPYDPRIGQCAARWFANHHYQRLLGFES